MLIFHEGLPGSGKSYEALVKHIVPNIRKGRHVYARINGLNHEKIAQLSEVTVERCQELLIHIPEESVFDIQNHVKNDSLVVIDELQNFFPSGRQKLDEGITKFVTEHRHRGIDIVAMGQSIADCHNLWKRRTQRKIQFLKLDMVGMDKRYKWTAFQGVPTPRGDIKFEKIKSKTEKYDETYFGSYASHQADTENTDNYEDDRLNLLKTNAIRLGIPAFLCVLVFAIFTLKSYFTPKEVQAVETKPVKALPQPATKPMPKKLPPPPEPKPMDFVQENNIKWESKITYLDLRRSYVWDMIVVWYDKSNKVHDRIYSSDLKDMGYKVENVGYGVQISKGDYQAVFRFRPDYEPAFSIARGTREQIKTDS